MSTINLAKHAKTIIIAAKAAIYQVSAWLQALGVSHV
jgi:hypothetical protein